MHKGSHPRDHTHTHTDYVCPEKKEKEDSPAFKIVTRRKLQNYIKKEQRDTKYINQKK